MKSTLYIYYSIHLKTVLINAQPSGASAENSAELIQVLCDRWPASEDLIYGKHEHTGSGYTHYISYTL